MFAGGLDVRFVAVQNDIQLICVERTAFGWSSSSLVSIPSAVGTMRCAFLMVPSFSSTVSGPCSFIL